MPYGSHSHFDLSSADLPTEPAYVLRPPIPTDGWSFTSASPHHSNDPQPAREYLTRFPSSTPFGLDLGVG